MITAATSPGGGGCQIGVASAPIPAATWTHIALRRSGGTVTLFKNGSAVGSTSCTYNFDNSYPLEFGRLQGAVQEYFWSGRIDEIQLHVGTALSDAQLLAIYNAGSDGQCLECGNGVLDPGESCDDGNAVENDACSNACEAIICGDGILTGAEECDDSNTTDGDGCDSNCTNTGCGNGIVTDGEQCDDGNAVENDACSNACAAIICGDGILTGAEECDDSNTTDGDGCDSNCTSTRCGNGVQTTDEQCDDGNPTNGDGCDSNCTFTGCGNRVQTTGEHCDDGNTTNGDGCDTNCTFTGCGNGIVTDGEQCDDGNAFNGDGCDNNCTTTACGNGVPTAGETCPEPETIDPNLSWDAEIFAGGANGDVSAIAVVGTDIYVGGNFSEFAGIAAGGIAKWNGSAWSELGTGFNGLVTDIVAIGSDIYVSGGVVLGDGGEEQSVAKWNGSSWSALGEGIEGYGSALVAVGSDLYVGGTLYLHGKDEGIARWDGTSWSALGSGVEGARVEGLAAIGTDIYAIGPFESAGGVPTKYIAKWNGTNWSAVGSGLPDFPHGIAAQRNNLLVVGDSFVARWSGTSWFVNNQEGYFFRVAVAGNNAVLMGEFDSIGGVAANNIAWWNGTNWLALGDGVNTGATRAVIDGDNVYVGGGFNNAGKRLARGIAVYHLPSCGDGFITDGEQCDDGNAVEGDGCDSNCTISSCGNGVTSAMTGEDCDDGNAVNGDGCDSNCTATACGNGALSISTGESCDDGNMIDGDGCDNDCAYTPVNVVMPPEGGTATTDPMGNGATPEIPTQVSITTTSGGTVNIDSVTDTVDLVDGVQLVGVAIEITAPAGTPSSPLEITLVIDPSALPAGGGYEQLEVIRNGIPLADCLSPTVADPDPCLKSLQVLQSGDLEFKALTSHASRWQIAVRGQTKDERKCVNASNASGLKVAKAQAKANRGCLKAAAKGGEGDPQSCLTADVKGKVAAVMDKTFATQSKKCVVSPPFGYTVAATINSAGRSAMVSTVADLFGETLNGVVIGSDNKAGAACQSAALKAVHKLFDTKAMMFLKCKKNGLAGKGSLMVSGIDLAGCFSSITADADGKLAKAVTKLEGTFAKKCAKTDIVTAIPGPCSLSFDLIGCLNAKTNCRLCQMFNAMDDLSADCDQFDDSAENGSCS